MVGVLEPAIQQAEIERTRRKRPENLNAYDHYLRSLALTNAFTREAAEEMLEGCLHTISLDPSFAPSLCTGGASLCSKADPRLDCR